MVSSLPLHVASPKHSCLACVLSDKSAKRLCFEKRKYSPRVSTSSSSASLFLFKVIVGRFATSMLPAKYNSPFSNNDTKTSYNSTHQKRSPSLNTSTPPSSNNAKSSTDKHRSSVSPSSSSRSAGMVEHNSRLSSAIGCICEVGVCYSG